MAQFKVVGRPTKERLAKALFDREPVRFDVIVHVEKKTRDIHIDPIFVSVNSVEAKGRSGESWLIRGHIGKKKCKISFRTDNNHDKYGKCNVES
jgi:hypothetical protein